MPHPSLHCRPRVLRAALLLVLTGTHAFAAPTGGVIVSGSGGIASAGTTTTINQATQRISLNWSTFNVGAAETVRFNQPSASALAVNRIADVNGSRILGKLQANGQVYLINPHGLIFGVGSQVNVGGLVASTLDIADADLAAGNHRFAGSGTAGVSNAGTLTAAPGGYVALLGGTVTNTGTISAPGGTVALGAGNRVTLDFAGDRLLSLAVTENAVDALAANGGLLRAEGGQVYLSAGGRDSLVASVVNNTGVIEARTVQNHGGKIILLGGMAAGTATVAGTLDASAPNGGDGGFVETSAARVLVDDAARVTTAAASADPVGQAGTWLIDPTNFIIAAGSGALTTSGIGADTLGTNLHSGNITLATSSTAHGADLGDLLVNSSVAWSAHQLTLSAHHNIYINANLTGTGTAKLVLLYGQGAVAAGNTADYTLATGAKVTLPAGANFSTKLGTDGTAKAYTVITRLGVAGSKTGTDLQGMNGYRSRNYALGGDLDSSATKAWNYTAGFAPIGNDTTPFTGTFAGLGHTITGLTIARPYTAFVGLFGYASGATLRDVGLLSGTVSGSSSVGWLVGKNESGTIGHAYSTGSISGSSGYVGGLVGQNHGGMISQAYSTGHVTGGADYVGGLVGISALCSISQVYSTSTVSGSGSFVGGLVGWNGSEISQAYSTGSVTGGAANVGGLVGYNSYGAISQAYSTGTVSGGGDYVGGLVGRKEGSTIRQAYSTGRVSGSGDDVGGLVGRNEGGEISQSYNTGDVSGGDYVGGLIGENVTGGVSQSYNTGDVSGDGYCVGGLIGENVTGRISQAYSTGRVRGFDYVGGLVGGNRGWIDQSYSTGCVWGGSENAGGLVGNTPDSLVGRPVSSSYWDTVTSGQPTSAGGTGKTTTQLRDADNKATNYGGFDFANVWWMAGDTRPLLRSEASTSITNVHQLQLMALDLGAAYALAADVEASATSGNVDAGVFASKAASIWGTAGFVPVGSIATPFTGIFAGNNFTILGLYNIPYIGLFGMVGEGGSVSGVSLFGGTGGLAGGRVPGGISGGTGVGKPGTMAQITSHETGFLKHFTPLQAGLGFEPVGPWELAQRGDDGASKDPALRANGPDEDKRSRVELHFQVLPLPATLETANN